MDAATSNQPGGRKEQIKSMIVSFAITAAVAFATKVITMLLARPEIDSVLIYLSEQHSFWFQLLGASGAAAFVTKHFVARK